MANTFWYKQIADKPLFPELLWSRPENRRHAGKLLIVGGNAHGFASLAEAYGESIKAGIGSPRVVLPDSLQKTVSQIFPEAEFAPSTPSGSFAGKSLAELLGAAAWSDGVLLAGDFGHNSETAILLEKFIEKYRGQLTLAGDSLDYFKRSSADLLSRPETTIATTFQQLQQIASVAHFEQALTSSMDLLHFVDALHELTQKFAINVITIFSENICVAVSGQVSTTKTSEVPVSESGLSAHAATWWLQNRSKPFEALSTATYIK